MMPDEEQITNNFARRLTPVSSNTVAKRKYPRKFKKYEGKSKY